MILSSLLLANLPLAEIESFAEHALTNGVSQTEVVDELVKIVDAMVDWAAIVPHPWGGLLDNVDSPALRALISMAVRKVQRRLESAPGRPVLPVPPPSGSVQRS